jgi:hypothetical protein
MWSGDSPLCDPRDERRRREKERRGLRTEFVANLLASNVSTRRATASRCPLETATWSGELPS